METKQKEILNGNQSGIGTMMDSTRVIKPSVNYRYKKKWQCKKCGHIFRAGEAHKKYRNYAGIHLFDMCCPECESNNLYSMIHN